VQSGSILVPPATLIENDPASRSASFWLDLDAGLARTYNRLTAQYWAAEERLDEMIVDVMERLMRRYGKIDFAA
jgi:hypothetical protein